MKKLRMFLKLAIICFMIFSYSNVWAQKDGDDISIGKYRVIHSKVLNEKRTLLVHLPRGYERSKLNYPVLYILDGDWKPSFYKSVAEIEKLTFNGDIPGMIIVAVKNVDRGRDMFPVKVKARPTSGGAEKFLNFFNEELFLFMKKNYRTQNYKILYGASNSGLFTVYSLFQKPDSFNAYIAASPMIGYCYKYMTEKINKRFNVHKSLNKFLYINHGKNDLRYVRQFLPQFIKLIKKNTLDEFVFKTKFHTDEGHVPKTSLSDGLLGLFSDIKVPEDVTKGGLEKTKEYYLNLSEKIGLKIEVPFMVLLMLGDSYDNQKKPEKAIEVKKHLISIYPFSNNGYFSLGESYSKAGKIKLAVKAYEKAYELEPLIIYKYKIKELENKDRN